MKLKPPFQISARLLPALQIGAAWIQLEFDGQTADGRTRYRWIIDLPDGTEHTGNDLASGVGGGTLQAGFGSLLSFLSACAESYRYKTRAGGRGENADLFPEPVASWAAENSDELALLGFEIEENPELISA